MVHIRCYNGCFVNDFILSLLAGLCVFVRSRAELALEIVALRQRVAILNQKHPRPQLNSLDRLFWIALRRLWPGWKQVLVIVKPDTVVGWHRTGFRWYWRWRSRRRPGRPRIGEQLRTLIRRLALENPSWGVPKIHGELLKLGFDLCERTVARYLRRVRRRGDPAKNWLTFLENHREVIVALDFFTVPTITFQLLYFLFVIHHGRRRILHFNVTRYPTAEWTLQQLGEAFPDAVGCRYLILDHDSKFDRGVTDFLKATGLEVKRTAIQAPWQNGLAERWVGSCRHELLDHIIAINEAHLRRLLGAYVTYHHEDRIHDALDKDTPKPRAIEPRPSPTPEVISMPRLGGLHHRYAWREAA